MKKSIGNSIGIIIIFLVFWLFSASGHANGEENKRLIFLHYWTGDMSGGINEMVNAFNKKNPGYDVRASGFEHETFKTSIKVMLEVGNPPDLFSYWAGSRIQDLVKQNYLADIDDIWTKADLNSKFTPSVAEACTYSGKKYAIPVTQHYVALFYNKAIFQKFSLKPPKTWTEFINTCEKLKTNGVTPIALGSREKWPAQFWFDYLLLSTAGHEYRQNLMDGKASYTDQQVMNTFSIWNSIIKYFNKNPNGLDWAEASKMVYNGEAAMTLMGTWIIGQFDTKLNWKQEKDYDFFSFPIINSETPQVGLGPIDCIVIPNTKMAESAKTALNYFSDIEPQKAMSKGSGAISPNVDIPASFYSPMQSKIRQAINQTKYWAFNYDLATPPPVAEAGLDCFFNFLKNPQDFKKVLTDTEANAHALFHKK